MALGMLCRSSVGSHRIGGLGYRTLAGRWRFAGWRRSQVALAPRSPFLLSRHYRAYCPNCPYSIRQRRVHNNLERGVVGFAGADPYNALDLGDEALTAADIP